MEGPFNTYELSLTKKELGAIDSSAVNVRDSRMNRTSISNPGFGANATAIGNLINVVTSGSGNTVVINAQQMNRGNQTAIVSLGASGNTEKLTNTPASTQTTTLNIVGATDKNAAP